MEYWLPPIVHFFVIARLIRLNNLYIQQRTGRATSLSAILAGSEIITYSA